MIKDLIGYEGKYKISSEGFIISLFTHKRLFEKIVSGGYVQVRLCNGFGEHKYKSVHRLIALHFLPNPDNLIDVNHKDGIKTNNQLENLEWCSHSENMLHCYNVIKTRIGIGKKKIQCLNTDTKEVTFFESISEAAQILDISRKIINDSLKENKEVQKIHRIFAKCD